MRKIKNTRQLNEEKRRLRQEEKEIKRRIKHNWRELKESFKPGKIVGEQFAKHRDERRERNMFDQSILESTLSFGASLLARKLARKAGEKFEKIFSK